MPVYSYECKCGLNLSVTRSIHDDEENPVCECGKVMQRVFYAPPTIFKGNGFYKTDK